MAVGISITSCCITCIECLENMVDLNNFVDKESTCIYCKLKHGGLEFVQKVVGNITAMEMAK